MAFFDELSKRMTGVAQSAQKATEIARLQRQVNLKQDEFDALFREIGQMYYDCHKRGEQPGEAMNVRCDRVDSLAAEIEGLKLKVDDLKEIRRCAACGSVQHVESKFCANCGAKLEPTAAQPVEEPEAPEEPCKPEEEKSVYINWPEAEKKADEDGQTAGAEASEEEKSEE